MQTATTQNPPRVEGPTEEESEKELELEKEEKCEEGTEAEDEQDEPPPPDYHTPDEDHISPARRSNRRETDIVGSLVQYSYSTRERHSLLDPNYQSRHLSPSHSPAVSQTPS